MAFLEHLRSWRESTRGESEALTFLIGVPIVMITFAISLSIVVVWNASNTMNTLSLDAASSATQFALPTGSQTSVLTADLSQIVGHISSQYSFPPMQCGVTGYTVSHPPLLDPNGLITVATTCTFNTLFFGSHTLTRSASVEVSYQHMVSVS